MPWSTTPVPLLKDAVSDDVPPTVTIDGATAKLLMLGGGTTVISSWPVTDPLVAVIVATPGERTESKPFESMLATPGGELVHVIVVPVSGVPFALYTEATNCTGGPPAVTVVAGAVNVRNAACNPTAPPVKCAMGAVTVCSPRFTTDPRASVHVLPSVVSIAR